MQENITTSIPASATSKPIQQTDIEQDYNFFQAQKVLKICWNLDLFPCQSFTNYRRKIVIHSLHFGWRLCPKSVDI